MKTTIQQGDKAYTLVRQGKVRDVYAAEDNRHLVIVASDRISAFDHVLPNPIPGKGRVLTYLSNFWFAQTVGIVRNHLVGDDYGWLEKFAEDEEQRESLRHRAVLVRKADPLPVEAIVRGYITGSGWKEYLEKGSVCGITLSDGLVESQALPEPIFTPSTKAEQGEHDENISFEQAVDLLGTDTANRVRDLSVRLYTFASQFARERGIIIADTKFEFGWVDGELILIDEIFTPDSSRFWPIEHYEAGRAQPSFDKQFVRDYLESVGWDKKPPAPTLPQEVINKTAQKYQESLTRLTQ